MINYYPKIPPNFTINILKMRLGYNGYCPDKKTIYLFGHEKDVDKWIYTLIHEEYHGLFHSLGIESKDHHKLINFLEVKKNG